MEKDHNTTYKMLSHAPLALATLHFNTKSKLTNACLQFSLHFSAVYVIHGQQNFP